MDEKQIRIGFDRFKASQLFESNSVNLSHVTSLVGTFYPEVQLKQFLDMLGFSEKPPLPRGETSAYLLRHDLGIEITLTGERYLDNPKRAYPEGAMVLENVRFYGAKDSDFAHFKGELPHELKFGLTLEELSTKFGQPSWFDEELAKARWDLEDYAVFADFDKQGYADVFGFQTPVEED